MMASKLTVKVRLVKCPKCRLVLPESPDLDLYQCGGCHTTLQAKKRVNDAKSIRSSLHDTQTVETNKPDHASECKEPSSSCSSSSGKEILPDSGEFSSCQNNGQDQNRSSGDFDSKHIGDVDLSKEDQNNRSDQNDCLDSDSEHPEVSNQVCSSIDVAGYENGELADNKNEDLADNEIENLADNKNEDLDDHEIVDLADNENEDLADNGIGDSADNEREDYLADENKDIADTGVEDLADNEFKNGDLADNEIGDLADNEHEDNLADNKDLADNGDKEHLADNENEEFPDNEYEKFSYKENEEFAHENGNFADNENESSEDTENEGFAHNGKGDSADNKNEELEDDENGEFYCNENQEFSHKKKEDFANNKNEESVSLPATDLKVAKNDKSSPSTEANMVDINRNGDSNLRSSSTVNLEATVGNRSIVSADRPVEHHISSYTCLSSPSEQLEQPQGSVHQGFGHLRSVETSETMEFNPSSELSGTLRDTSKSSTVRSAHAYDGSISSYDGIDDQLPNPHMHSFQDTYKASHFVHSEERSRRDKLLVKSMMNKNSQMPYQARNSCSDKKKNVLKNNKWNQDEFLEPPRHGHKVRNWTRSERDEYQPRLAFPQIGPRPGYENGSLSSQLHDEFHRNSGFQSSDLSEDLEQDNMKLMRMIFELQDQLNKTLSLHEMGNDGISVASRKPRYIPRYHNYDASEEEHFHHSNYPRYGRYEARSSYSQQQRRPMQIPFSGEATCSGHQVDPSCLHCRPQDWHRSAQFPPPLPYNNNKRYRIHPVHNCSTSYNSCPSSPQRFVDSEYPLRGREAMSDDQRRKSLEMKSYLREKPHLVRRHLRPIAGGAPFITCYKCYKLLQLPADFLLFKRRSHRLRCGGCSQVLKFSLFDGSRIVPYTMNAMDPPPSEVEDCSGAIDTRNLPSTSQANDFLYAEPVSCSDDYGLSHCQSCSTEGDLVSTTFHTHQGSVDGRKMSNGSYDPVRGKQELVSRQSRNNYKNSLLRYENAGPSSSISKEEKFSSEIKQLPPSSGSPLHRLMGYSSPSQVIYGPSRERTNSYSMQKETERRN